MPDVGNTGAGAGTGGAVLLLLPSAPPMLCMPEASMMSDGVGARRKVPGPPELARFKPSMNDGCVIDSIVHVSLRQPPRAPSLLQIHIFIPRR